MARPYRPSAADWNRNIETDYRRAAVVAALMAEEHQVVRRIVLVLTCIALSACSHADALSQAVQPSRSAFIPVPTAAPASSDPDEPPAQPSVESAWQSRGSLLGIVNGLAFIGDDVRVRAFRVTCRHDCSPVITTHLSAYSDVIASDGEAYIGTGHGVAVLDLGCRGFCKPVGWLRSTEVLRANGNSYLSDSPDSYAPVAIGADAVIVRFGWDGYAGSGIFSSRLAGYSFGCTRMCDPLWTTPLADGRMPPAVSGDLILAPRAGVLDSFACVPSPEQCSPRWSADLAEPGADATWTETPTIVGDTAIVSTDGCACGYDSGPPIVAAYPVDCSLACEPLWRTTLDRTRFQSGVAADGTLVYVATEGPGGAKPIAVGMDLDCTGTCPPAARYELPRGDVWTTPLLYQGSVFIGSSQPGGVAAFDATCRGTCTVEHALSLRRPVEAIVPVGRTLLVASGSDLFRVPTEPGAGRWRPSWHWHGGMVGIDNVFVQDGMAVVAYPRRTIAVALP